MRPASLVLLSIGIGLLIGTALVASFKIKFRGTGAYSVIDDQFIRTDCNVWGQPLWAVCNSNREREKERYTVEMGPYPNGVRQGKWIRINQEPGRPTVESDIWFLDGREVSAAEWEQRQ